MLRVLSLGAGVQSTTMALMAAHGEIEPPSCAIFADTQNEPRHTDTIDPKTGQLIGGGIYGWLDWLEPKLPFPVHRVTQGDLMADSQVIRTSKRSGRKYMKSLIPAFLHKPNGSIVLFGRKCTADYKITPIQRKVKELLGVKRGPKNVVCDMLVGISLDETIRMKPSRVAYINHVWPLIDKRMTRQDCLNWMSHNGYPIPPRSACVACPFHADREWRHLKETAPADFDNAVEIERSIQSAAREQEAFEGVPYLHASGIPLAEIDFDAVSNTNQLDLFLNECEGMCGV